MKSISGKLDTIEKRIKKGKHTEKIQRIFLSKRDAIGNNWYRIGFGQDAKWVSEDEFNMFVKENIIPSTYHDGSPQLILMDIADEYRHKERDNQFTGN